jgi:hypothetical protein
MSDAAASLAHKPCPRSDPCRVHGLEIWGAGYMGSQP